MGKSSKFKLRISYNSPVILTFCIFCTLILLFDKIFFAKLNIVQSVFTVPGHGSNPDSFNFKSLFDYFKLFTHVLGHASWNHLVGNLTFILLIGPLLEERYGSPMLLLMICVTALVTGVLNACLIPTPLLGASGIAFMLIILSSFTSISKNEIPLSFILVFILFLGSEMFLKTGESNISVLAHVAGGICGSMFGFLIAPKASNSRKEKSPKTSTYNSGKTWGASDSSTEEKKKSIWRREEKSSDSEETIIGTIEL